MRNLPLSITKKTPSLHEIERWSYPQKFLWRVSHFSLTEHSMHYNAVAVAVMVAV